MMKISRSACCVLRVACSARRRARTRTTHHAPRPASVTLHASRIRHHAFTLLEIMIAIAIFGMVLTAIYSTWLAILRGKKAGETAAAEVQRSRIAIRALE